MAFVRKWKWAIGIATALLTVAVGWWAWSTSHAPEPPAAEETETPRAEPLPMYGPDAPAKWSWTSIPWRLMSFTPPPGHWAYFSQWNREFLLIPGAPLPDGAPAPNEEELYAQAVVVMNEVLFDRDSFPTWESMEVTMAEFACARGKTEEDYVLCEREPANITSSVTPSGLPFRSFTLPQIAYQTRQRVGTAPFTVVRLGEESALGLLVYAIDSARGRVPMQALVRSLEPFPEVGE